MRDSHPPGLDLFLFAPHPSSLCLYPRARDLPNPAKMKTVSNSAGFKDRREMTGQEMGNKETSLWRKGAKRPG
jgi:hypothetical protein